MSELGQMIPADGWYVRYWLSLEPFYEFRRLVAFTQVKKNGSIQFNAIDDQSYLADRTDKSFAGYFHERDIDAALRSESAKYGANIASQKK